MCVVAPTAGRAYGQYARRHDRWQRADRPAYPRQGRSPLDAHLDAATLVLAATRAIDIGKTHDDARDNIPAVIQGVGEARGHMLAQYVGQGLVLSLDLQVHWRSSAGLEEDAWIMGKVTIRYKQI